MGDDFIRNFNIGLDDQYAHILARIDEMPISDDEKEQLRELLREAYNKLKKEEKE